MNRGSSHDHKLQGCLLGATSTDIRHADVKSAIESALYSLHPHQSPEALHVKWGLPREANMLDLGAEGPLLLHLTECKIQDCFLFRDASFQL